VQVLTESLKINPGYEYALEMMGDIAQGSGEVKQAIEFYRMLLSTTENFFRFIRN
jgi:Tfp pilus assembly protein PilF